MLFHLNISQGPASATIYYFPQSKNRNTKKFRFLFTPATPPRKIPYSSSNFLLIALIEKK